MTSKERFLTALSGGTADRAPLAYVAALTNRELQERTGCFMPAVHTDGNKLFRLCAAAHEVLGFDAVTFIINAFGEPAALGCRMDWGGAESLPMYLSHPWASEEDILVPTDLLTRDPVAGYLESIRLAARRLGDRIAVVGKVVGPLTMTQVMHGVQETMIGLIDSPSLIRRFLDASVEILVRCANAQLEAGAVAVSIGEGGAGASMISPPMYESFLTDVHRDMISRIKGPTVMHMCGDITPRLATLKEEGFTCFNFDRAVDPVRMKGAAADSFSLMGNVGTTDLLYGTPEAIERQVAECLDAGIDIISPGCAVSPLCPTANLAALASGITRWYEGRSGSRSIRGESAPSRRDCTGRDRW